MGCNCDGSAAASAQNVGQFTIQLPNGSKVGKYPSEAAAVAARDRYYAGRGQVVPR